MDIIKARAFQLLPDEVLQGEGVSVATKYYHEVASLYENPRDDDPVVYEVYTQDVGSHEPGNLFWGLTILKPLLSHGECNMTRGHFHCDRSCAEYYFCLKGEGLLLLMDEEGRTWAEKMVPGTLHHIDGSLAHRCVNTSEHEELRVGACWPVQSGHDYASIERREFAYRVKRLDGALVCVRREAEAKTEKK